MISDIIEILKIGSSDVFNKEFAEGNLIEKIGKPTDIVKRKGKVIYRYDHIEITFWEGSLYSLLFDEMNNEYESDNAVICKFLKPLIGINLLKFKSLLNEKEIVWEINRENTFDDQICLGIESKWLIYFNAIDETIRSAMYKSS